MKIYFKLILVLLISTSAFSQNKIEMQAIFDVPNKTIQIKQYIAWKNTSKDTLKTIYLNDWNNSYSTKNTPLATRFTEEFNNKFHFAKSDQRGYTIVTSVKDTLGVELPYDRIKDHLDVLKIDLNTPLPPGENYTIILHYNLLVPNNTFTGYGVSDGIDFNLKYWYLAPAVYDGEWHYYSNKNLDDFYTPPAEITLEVVHPRNYALISELNTISLRQTDSTQTVVLNGKNRVNTNFVLTKFPNYKYVKANNVTVVTNIDDGGLKPHERALVVDKIVNFMSENMIPYPHERLLLTEIEYKKNPLYGLNQLPNFIRPFPDGFQYELKLLKTALNNYLENTLLLNPRDDYWFKDGLQVYFLMKYIEEYYPDMKFLGMLADIWGIRAFHASDLKYNDQYNLFFMQMARTNRDQPLTMPKDSLLKFNANIAGKYKAGVGLKYLGDFIQPEILDQTISQYFEAHHEQLSYSKDFEALLKQNTSKDIDWFFEDYINTRKKIDFKIKNVKRENDSISLTIKNKRHNSMPVSFFTMAEDSVLSKTWIENIHGSRTIKIPEDSVDKLVLNYDKVIPEINLRDNWKSPKGWFFNNKPLQIRLFKDIEDPNYNQVFVMPIIEYRNIYDGLTLGTKLYNKTLLRKRLNYKFSPKYATHSNILTGSASVSYTHNLENQDLYNITYGLHSSYSSFAKDAFVSIFTPSLTFSFRDDKNFRSNQSQYINMRYVDISRTYNDPLVVPSETPDYGVFNIRYIYANPGLVNYSKWYTDFQLADKFGKLAVNYEYRKLYQNNRQLNLRFFAGTFIYNNNEDDSDYFSFALDRPTDYLFDYDYLGRSEQSGIFSQQIIIAEGGFKSKLDPAFANQWMATMNLSTTIWRYIEAYGDMGVVKNKYNNAEFVYDSGIKLDLVTDYFEIYFPIYSNLGWEVGQPEYDQKIRFKFTVDPKALLGLFRRRWF
ncbi:metalloprotease [Mangrovimonas sp. DI 80]|nr:metalloprotease [Mangrovimonas sp. DI 80]